MRIQQLFWGKLYVKSEIDKLPATNKISMEYRVSGMHLTMEFFIRMAVFQK